MNEASQVFILIVMFAILVQFCVDRIKVILGEKIMSYVKAPVWALGFGVLLALVFRLDIFTLLGLSSAYPIVTIIVTGLIISAGAAPIHELIEKLRQARLNDEQFFLLESAIMEEGEQDAKTDPPH